ncbi:uncharacterized protein N7511_008424 [Penicillium nucicola]|uniref:uncharacterized protein n=1 Tax=Penicillium nucicola TaxID=1850975 RepID=UPI0025451015|nr:uncharacterized protein N7511_008424 [Penicillium nucicola]KAJ5751459.1 hypothetical protein N7511_008424 [Penicillium nucicola]
MSDHEEAQPACVVEIAETGDVFLVTGPEKLKLRVESLILKATSKPFAAMLGPNWTRGREQPSSEKPVEILLPEDNAVSLKYICAVTHSRSQMIPKDVSAQDILDIAILADKYDFFDALEMASRSWLQVCEKNEAGNMALMAAAFVFGNAQSFRQTSKALVMDYAGSYLEIYTERIEKIMDWRAVCK